MERELMLVLGITTSTAQVGCAIGGHEGVLGAIHSSRGRRHAETLTPAIEFLCRQTRVELADIGAVAVDLGPGMFTGLRVGVVARSEEHTSELQSLMRISYAVFFLKKKKQ